MARSSSKRVIYAALVGNLLVAGTKFIAAGFTGSAAMLSEAIHSLWIAATNCCSCWALVEPHGRRMPGTPSAMGSSFTFGPLSSPSSFSALGRASRS